MSKLFNPSADYEASKNLPKERAVRSILNTSISDGKLSLKGCDDIQVLEECIKREEGREAPRAGILKPLSSKLAKLKQSKGELSMVVDNNPEVQHPEKDIWARAKQYSSAAKHFARASVACQVMLGFELTAIKKELGFVQGGKRGKSKTENASVFKTWEEHTKAELGITDRTARTYINMAEAAKRRLKSCYNHLPLLEKPVTEFNDQQLELLTKAVNKITDGQTQSQFLVDCGIAKAPQGSAAKGGNLGGEEEKEEKQEEPTMEQFAFMLFASPVNDLCTLRSNPEYKRSLHALPVTSTDEEAVTLSQLEQQTESFLADIREAKEAALKSHTPETALTA